MMKHSVILPIYRNAKTLRELCGRLEAALRPLGEFEIVLVIDASPDDSNAVAGELAAVHPWVKVVELTRNIGQSRTILTGLSYAQGEIAVVMDADLQDPPEAVPALVRMLEGDSGMDVLFATRMNRYSSVSRHVTSRLFKLVMRLLSRGRIPANAGLFLALRRRVYTQMARQRDSDVHLLGVVARTARRSGATPVARAASEGGSYTSGMRLAAAWKSVRTLLGIPRRGKITPVEVRRTRNISSDVAPVCR